MSDHDAIVIGVGGMGSAACYHLARRGRRVLGLERFSVPNEMGSSHGVTRIIRFAYFEGVGYVPLLRRARELWGELEREAGEPLFHVTGCLQVGPPDGDLVSGVRRACEVYDLPHEVLSGPEVTRRFGVWRVPDGAVGVLEPDGGFLTPERCIAAHARLAEAAGAEIHTGERVLGWEPRGDGVRVTTDRGAYDAERLVVTAGAWASSLVPELDGLAVPERQVLGWFDTGSAAPGFAPDRFPVFLAEARTGLFYGLPEFEAPGVKLGLMYHLRQRVDPDTIDRGVHPEDEDVLRAFVREHLPDADRALLDARVCMFTNTPDLDFVIDVHPACPQVVVAAGFSGHGFKFCSVVGEVLADLAIEGATRYDIGFLRLGRLM